MTSTTDQSIIRLVGGKKVTFLSDRRLFFVTDQLQDVGFFNEEPACRSPAKFT